MHWTDWISTSAPVRAGTLPDAGSYRLVLTRQHIDNGDSQLTIELGTGGAAALGDWMLELQSVNSMPDGEIHAWIERTPGTPSTFIDHPDEEMTLSIPATAEIVVGMNCVFDHGSAESVE